MTRRLIAQRLTPDAQNRFLLDALRAHAHGAALPPAPGGDHWVERANSHGIFPFIAGRLGGGATRTVRLTSRSHAAHLIQARRDMTFLRGVLDDRQIQWLLFKGFALTELAYPRTGDRSFYDIDALVAPEDMGQAIAALEESGAVLLDRNWPLILETMPAELSLRLPHGTLLDLHWNMANDPSTRRSLRFRTRDLLDRSTPISIDGEEFTTLDPLDTVLHTALHGCRSGATKLRWILDLYCCLQKLSPDAVALWERARATRTELVLRVMTRRVEEFMALPPGFASMRARAMGDRGWLALDSAVMHRSPPGAAMQGARSGWVVMRSVRGDGWESFRALGSRLAGSAVAKRKATSAGEAADGNPLALVRGGQAERETYIARAVSSEGAPRPTMAGGR